MRLESESFEDAIRMTISIGGGSDTIACITGGIAQAFYGGDPEHIEREVMAAPGGEGPKAGAPICRRQEGPPVFAAWRCAAGM